MKFHRDHLSHVLVADHADFDITSWVISMYIRVDTLPTSGQTATLLTKGDPPTYRIDITEDAVIQVTSGSDVHLSTVVLSVGLWYRIVWLHNGTSNLGDITATSMGRASTVGALAPYSDTFSPPTNSSGFRIGCGESSSAPADGFDGSIVDVYLNSGTSGPSAVASPFTRYTGQETDTVAYWRMDDAAQNPGQTTVSDNSGNGHDGTPTFSPEWTNAPWDLYYPASYLDGGLLAWPSWTRGAETAIDEVGADADYPGSNLRIPRQVKTHRWSDATGTKTRLFNFMTPRRVVVLVINNHNLSSQAVVLAEFDTSAAFSPAAISETVTYAPDRLVHIFAYPYQYQFARVSITDTANGDGYIELGTCDWFDGLEILDDPQLESWPLTDPTTIVTLPHGHEIPRALNPRQAASFALTYQTRGQGYMIRRFVEGAAEGEPCWICPDVRTGLYSRSAYGVLTDLPSESMVDPAWVRTDFSNLSIDVDRP